MELALASIVLDATLGVAEWIKVGLGSRRNDRAQELIVALQGFDPDKAIESLSPLKLAASMQGAVTVPLLEPVLATPAFSSLCKEVFLAVLADASAAQKEKVKQSIQEYFLYELDTIAAEGDIRQIAGAVHEAIQVMCTEWMTGLTALKPEVLSILQQGAVTKRISSVLDTIENHLTAMRSQRESDEKTRKKNWLETYRVQCYEAHGYIVPPDFETNRKVPIDDLYVSPQFAPLGPATDEEGTPRLSASSMLKIVDRTVILGDPGGGKSTYTSYVTSSWAKDSSIHIVPFHVTLREFAKHNDERSVVQQIETQLSATYQCPAPSGAVHELLAEGSAAVVFDGLDELIDTTKRRAVTQAVEMFASRYPHCKILVTSRRVGYKQARLDPAIFSEYIISDFASDDVESYVHKWFATQSDYSGRDTNHLSQSFIEQSVAVPDLIRNPLMLALMCIIFRGENFIPRNRPDVYEKCATLLFEKWDGHRVIEVPLRAKQHVDAAMKHIAYWMLTSDSGDTGVSYEELVREMSKYLQERAFSEYDDARRAAEEFVDFCRGRAWVFSDAGTTASGESLWTFTHRTFMEYFAAYHLTRISPSPERLARTLVPKIAQGQWDVVAQLAVQISNKSSDQGSERVLSELLNDRRKRTHENRENIYSFITRCLNFAVVSEDFVDNLTSKCLDSLIQADHFEQHIYRFFTGFTAWLPLMENGYQHHRRILAKHREVLGVRLHDGDPKVRGRAANIILWGATAPETFPLLHDETARETWKRWNSLFIGLATDYHATLLSIAQDVPALNLLLVAAGLDKAEPAYRRLVEMDIPPGNALFTTFRSPASLGITYSIVDYFFTQAYRYPDQTLADLDQLGDISSLIQNVFLKHQYGEDVVFSRSNPFGFPPLIAPRSYQHLPAVIQKNEYVMSALTLAHLGTAELMPNIFTTRGKNSDSDLFFQLVAARSESNAESASEAIQGLNVNDEVRSFLHEWTSGKATVLKLESAGTSDSKSN